MKWISVKEKLPELFIDVLAYCINECGATYEKGDRYCCIDRLCKWTDDYPESFRTDRFYGHVTHWMLLPEFPKEDC